MTTSQAHISMEPTSVTSLALTSAAAQASTAPSRARMIAWSSLAAVYVVIRFGLTQQLELLGPYASYIFELCDVVIAAFLAGRLFLQSLRVSRAAVAAASVSLAAGFAIYKGDGALHIGIPFDLQSGESLVFLLFIGPVLEEMLFRFFLWRPLEWFSGRASIAWLASSLFFSYSHLHAIWFVPEEIHPFIVYQTIYTLALGLACGAMVWRQRSLSGAILIHLAFNMGFWLASLGG